MSNVEQEMSNFEGREINIRRSTFGISFFRNFAYCRLMV